MSRNRTPKPAEADLFGQQAVSAANLDAYAGTPGLGPAGRQCRHCRFYARIQPRQRIYLKCARIRHRWTQDQDTDIKASTPACELFQEREG